MFRQPTHGFDSDQEAAAKPVWLRSVFAGLMVAIVAAIAYVLFLGFTLSQVSTNPLGFGGLKTDTYGRTNVLVLGMGDKGHSGENLTDTMLLLISDSTLGRMAEVSIPRDLRVKIPDYGVAKINAAHAYGGPALANRVVSDVTGTTVEYYVRTDFSGLKSLVDAVGGIEVQVKDRMADPDYPCDDNQYASCGLVIESGTQHMDGTKVLQYTRCRKGTCGNDFGRSARQQEILGLLKEKILSPAVILNPLRMTALASAMRQFVQTNLGALQLLQFVNQWQSFSQGKPVTTFVLSTAPDGLLRSSGGGYLVPAAGDFSVIQHRIEHIFNEDNTNN